MAACPAIAGAWSASRRCSSGNRIHEQRSRQLRGVPLTSLTQRIVAIDWDRLVTAVDVEGYAVVAQLLSPEECAGWCRLTGMNCSAAASSWLAMASGAASTSTSPIRSRMWWPNCVPRCTRHFRRSPIAGMRPWAWKSVIRTNMRSFSGAAMVPARLGRHRCCCSTEQATTTACTRTLRRARVPAAGRHPAVEPGKDFTGGEFVLTEQRPRMQSRVAVVPLEQGSARGICGKQPAGAGNARDLSGQDAPWGEPDAIGQQAYAGYYFSRRGVKRETRGKRKEDRGKRKEEREKRMRKEKWLRRIG